MSEKLLKAYEDILTFAGCTTDKNGFIFSEMDGESKVPLLIDGEQLVLPTHDNLRHPEGKKIFHPMRENLMRKESPTIQRYKDVLSVRLNLVLSTLAMNLINIAASPQLQKQLKGSQVDIITTLGHADEKTLNNFIKITAAATKHSPFKSFVSLFLNRGGSLNSKRYARTCVVTFPFYDQLVTGENKPYNVKIRNQDTETYTRLMELILPGINQQHHYSAGSESQVAPYMEALMDSAYKLASNLNIITDMFKDYIDDYEMLVFDDAWYETFNEIKASNFEILKVPSQPENEGDTRLNDDHQIKEVAVPHSPRPKPPEPQVEIVKSPPVAPVTAPMAPMHQQPARTGGLSMAELLNGPQNAMPPPPQYPQYPQYPQQPMYPQYPQAPGVFAPPPPAYPMYSQFTTPAMAVAMNNSYQQPMMPQNNLPYWMQQQAQQPMMQQPNRQDPPWK